MPITSRHSTDDHRLEQLAWPPRDSRLIEVVDTWHPESPPRVLEPVPPPALPSSASAGSGRRWMAWMVAAAIVPGAYVLDSARRPAASADEATVSGPFQQGASAITSPTVVPATFDGTPPAARPEPVDTPPAAPLQSAAEVPVATPTRLQVHTEPAGLPVLVDGDLRGNSPLTLTGVRAGQRTIVVRGPAGDVTQSVTVARGTTVALHVPVPTMAAPGWLSVRAPVELQVFEEGQLVGTSRVERVMLPSGSHTLDLVNDDIAFRTQVSVTVPSGRALVLPVEVPAATLAINAQPWADVFVEGTEVGQTPLADLTWPAGRHEFRFVHPELGERRRTVVLRAGQPFRLTVDLRRP